MDPLGMLPEDIFLLSSQPSLPRRKQLKYRGRILTIATLFEGFVVLHLY